MSNTPILLIGGQPKGFDEPFDIRTHSGKILRPMLEESGRPWMLLDLWNNQKEERKGEINSFARAMILAALDYKYDVFVLGRYQQTRLEKAGIHLPYLPHPSSRRSKDRAILRQTLLGNERFNNAN